MTLSQNSIRFNRNKRTVCFLIVSLVTVAAYSQQDATSEEWLTAITNKHDIAYDSFTRYGNFIIIGKKGNDGELETYKAATVFEKGPEGYWIIKSERVSYDPSSTTLEINDCMLEKFLNNSNSLDPEESLKHINITINITEKTSTMLPAKLKHTN